jgi:YfiH family protein
MTPEFITHASLRTPHGFFTRLGGVSEGPYASLNASLSGGDDIARVTRNRALVAQTLGVAAGDLVGVKQVHGTVIVTVREAWPPGTGQEADGMVTAIPGLALGVITADCAPVLLCDATAGVIGAVHAGWRGAVAGVLEQAVTAMTALGASPAAIAAVVGPCIGPDAYEVGPDLRDAVLAVLRRPPRRRRRGTGCRDGHRYAGR